MQLPLTDVEYLVLDFLADGALQLTWLVHELHEGKRALDPGLIINCLAKLVEHELIQYCQSPGGPNYTQPAPELIHAQVLAVLNNGEQRWWVELTDSGQGAWESWQQSHFGS